MALPLINRKVINALLCENHASCWLWRWHIHNLPASLDMIVSMIPTLFPLEDIDMCTWNQHAHRICFLWDYHIESHCLWRVWYYPELSQEIVFYKEQIQQALLSGTTLTTCKGNCPNPMGLWPSQISTCEDKDAKSPSIDWPPSKTGHAAILDSLQFSPVHPAEWVPILYNRIGGQSLRDLHSVGHNRQIQPSYECNLESVSGQISFSLTRNWVPLREIQFLAHWMQASSSTRVVPQHSSTWIVLSTVTVSIYPHPQS